MITRFLFACSILASLLIASCEVPQEPCDCGDPKVPTLTNDVQGAAATRLKGTDAGLPLDSLPGVKCLTTQELLKMEEPPKTGLFLIDTDFVPQELSKELKEAGYTLHPDGTLDSAEVQIALYVQTAVYKLDRLADPSDEQPSESLQTPQVTSRAFPQPWAGYSYSFWWKYNGGFCRSYEAQTRAYAYGPPTGGFWPYTNVQWMQTYAAVGGSGDSDHCANCFSEHSKDDWNIGCFWPAHGGASGYHYMYIYDSGASAFTNWSW